MPAGPGLNSPGGRRDKRGVVVLPEALGASATRNSGPPAAVAMCAIVSADGLFFLLAVHI